MCEKSAHMQMGPLAEQGLRFASMYTTANLFLVVVAGASSAPWAAWLKGLAASNSLLILAAVHTVQILYPVDFSRMYTSFALEPEGSVLMDFIVHVLPVLLAMRWLPMSSTMHAVLPMLCILAYMGVANIQWVYGVRELDKWRVVVYAFVLYAAGLAMCKLSHPHATWAFVAVYIACGGIQQVRKQLL